MIGIQGSDLIVRIGCQVSFQPAVIAKAQGTNVLRKDVPTA